MPAQSDFTIEVRDRDFVRLGQIAPEFTDLKFIDVHNGVGQWELKLPAEHPLLPALKAKGAGIVVTEHWISGLGIHTYRTFSGFMRSARLSQDAEDPVGTWIVKGVDDNIVAAATRVYPDPANLPTAQTLAYWSQTGTAETIMKLAVQLNAGSAAIASRKYSWLSIAANSLRGGLVSCSSRFDVLGDLLTSLGTAGGLGWEFRQSGTGIAFDVYTPQDKTGEIRLDIRNGGLTSNELGFTAPSASEVLVMGQGEGAARTILKVTSPEASAEQANWVIRWEQVKDQRNTNDPVELTQAGVEILTDQGATVNSLKVVPSDTPGMALGRDWYRGDRITVVVDGQETTALVTQVAVSITSVGVIRQVTIGDPVGFDFDAKVSSKVRDVEQRVGQVERLIGQGASWGDISGVPAGIVADTGDVKATARRTPPAGWLKADGAAVSRATYDKLFAALNERIGTFTIAIGAAAAVTMPAHGLRAGQMVFLTTTGTLPTGLVPNKVYYVSQDSTNAFRLATTGTNAPNSVTITTSGTQSGVHSIWVTHGVGDGSTTFNVPDLTGRTIVGFDGTQDEFKSIGQSGGTKTETLTVAQMPSHNHAQNVTALSGGSALRNDFSADAAGGVYPQGVNTNNTGGGQAHNNLSPYMVMNYIIKT